MQWTSLPKPVLFHILFNKAVTIYRIVIYYKNAGMNPEKLNRNKCSAATFIMSGCISSVLIHNRLIIITWTWLIVFFWFHQRCESGIAQSFCRLTLLLFPCPFRGQQLGQENWHQGGHIRLGIFAPSNLDFSEGGFVASIWLVDLGCIRCNLVEDSLARGLAGTRGHWHPSSHPRVKPIFAYNPGRRGSSTSRTELIIAVSFRFYAFLEAFQLWLPGFPLVVIMFNCWLARATLRFDCGSQERSQFCCLNLLACSSVLIVFEPTQTWYLSDALKGWLFVLVVDRVFFISIFLIFWWNLENLLVNHQNLEKVCKYLCNIWESV